MNVKNNFKKMNYLKIICKLALLDKVYCKNELIYILYVQKIKVKLQKNRRAV